MLSMINYFNTLNSNVSSGLLKQVEKKVILNNISITIYDHTFKNQKLEDELYKNSKNRQILPRGCSVILIDNEVIHVIYGHPKFGNLNDYDEGKEFLTRVYTRKENGQCGHISAFIHNNIKYLVVGSKNVHIIVRCNFIQDDIEIYKNEVRYTVAINIINLLISKYSNSIDRLVNFVIEHSVTFCCEAIFKHDQHIVDYDEEEYLKFFAITKLRETVDSPITWCNPLIARDHFNNIGLDTVFEIISSSDKEEWLKIEEKITLDDNSEGGVISCLDSNGNVVYVYKFKNNTYVFMRAVREQMRKLVNDESILKRIKNLHFEHPNKESLTLLALQFNAFFRLLSEDKRSTFFNQWNKWFNEFNKLSLEEKNSLLETYKKVQLENGSLTVIIFVGIQGSGKSTMARLLLNLISMHYTNLGKDEITHLEQDMYNGNSKLYYSAIDKAISNSKLRFLILAKMNHTKKIRDSTCNILSKYNGNLQKFYIIFDPKNIEFYERRIIERGLSHKVFFHTEKTREIIEKTLIEFEPLTEEEENSSLHLDSDQPKDIIINQIFDFFDKNYIISKDESKDLFQIALNKVIDDDLRLSKDSIKRNKKK